MGAILTADEPGKNPPDKNPLAAPLYELKHEVRVDALAITSDGKLLASATAAWKDDKATSSIHLWSLEDGTLKKSWEVGPGSIETLAFSPDGRTLASGGKGSVSLWSTLSNALGKQTKVLSGHTRDVSALAFSPDGKMLASGSLRPFQGNLAGELFLWDLAMGTKREILMNGPGGATTLAFSLDGSRLASQESQFAAGVWDVVTLEPIATMSDQAARGVLITVAFSADGKTLATGDSGHGLRLWDAQTGKLQATLLQIKDDWDGMGPSGDVEGIVFCADGKMMVSAGTNQEGPGGEAELFVWDWPARKVKHSLIAPPNYGINHFAASPDGKVFATVESLSETTKVWRLP